MRLLSSVLFLSGAATAFLAPVTPSKRCGRRCDATLSDVGRQIARIPECVCVAMDSMPTSFYMGVYDVSLTGLLLVELDLASTPTLTAAQQNTVAAFGIYAVAACTFWIWDRFYFKTPRRRVDEVLTKKMPYQLPNDIVVEKSADFVVTIADYKVFEPFRKNCILAYADQSSERRSLENGLLYKFRYYLWSPATLENLGRLVADFVEWRRPSGGPASVPIVVQVAENLTKDEVTAIFHEATVFKAVTGTAVDLIISIPNADQLPPLPPGARLKRMDD